MNYLENLRKQDINISTAGDNQVIALGQGEMASSFENPATYIAIDFISFIPNGNVTIQFKSGTTNYGGPILLVAGQAYTVENAIRNEHGIITMKPNQAFVMNLSSAVQVSGFIRYRLNNTN